MMDSASPTATASTNRGGRPKDWTEPRTRRLIRLYLFTTLPFPQILKLLEEDEFKPGKDAANKVKNSVLGNDPRWIRPKDDEEEKARIRGLRNSLRGRRCRQTTAGSQNPSGAAPEHGLTPEAFADEKSLGGSTITHSYRSSIEELNHPDFGPFAYSGTSADAFTMPQDDVASSWFIPNLFGRLDSNRQDTGLTTSTDISITSALREKLSFLSISKAKRTVKVLKRYTFPKNLESQRASDAASNLFHGPELYSPADHVNGPINATYAVPGDFFNAKLYADKQQCTAESPAHAAGVCWCKIDKQVSPIRNVWANCQVPGHTSSPSLLAKDIFGNTIFHYLASVDQIQDLFCHLVSQALYEPRLPIRDVNTAGQTFLHVLHYTWFQDGSRLTELIEMLRNGGFDIFATDVYGRNFYHNLRRHLRDSARFPGQASDISRMNRRDAFGLKPMDTRPSPDINHTPTHAHTPQGVNTKVSPGLGRPTPRINTQAGAVENKELHIHADLLRVVLKAVGVDAEFSPNAQTEDSQGRNGFHCLAEVDLCLSPATPKPGSRGHVKDESKLSPPVPNKRRHNDDEIIEAPRTASDSRRLECVNGLINAKVDANQYDKHGTTPLMSFVINSSDATKCEKEESEAVLRALVKKAGARLELRNRSGETALHLAARHGKTVALRVLLELGANPHTRNGQGLSILEVLDNLYVTTERDDKNNARFEACRAILTRSKDFAIQSPTLIDEWGMK